MLVHQLPLEDIILQLNCLSTPTQIVYGHREYRWKKLLKGWNINQFPLICMPLRFFSAS